MQDDVAVTASSREGVGLRCEGPRHPAIDCKSPNSGTKRKRTSAEILTSMTRPVLTNSRAVKIESGVLAHHQSPHAVTAGHLRKKEQ